MEENRKLQQAEMAEKRKLQQAEMAENRKLLQAEMAENRKLLQAEMAEIRKLQQAQVLAAMEKKHVFLSYSKDAEEAEEFLGFAGTWLDVRSGQTGNPAITKKESAALRKCSKGSDIVKALTPRLEELCVTNDDPDDPCPMVLVNSEDCPWLRTDAGLPGTRLDSIRHVFKPDLWLTWKPFVLYKSPEDALLPIGVLGGVALQSLGCVAAVFAARDRDVALTRPQVGKLLADLACVSGAPCLGMLFNDNDYVLCAHFLGAVAKRVDGLFTAKGSEHIIRDFFKTIKPPLLVKALSLVLQSLKLKTVHVNGRCYLGSGAHGHVFTVAGHSPTSSPRALKLAIFNNKDAKNRFGAEYQCIEAAQATGAPVVHVQADSFASLKLEGRWIGGYVLEQVGEPVETLPVTRKKTTITSACNALAALHNAGIIHGDARLANLVVVAGAYKWIDLGAAKQPTLPEAFREASADDAESLARSVLLTHWDAPLPEDVASAVASYNHAAASSVSKLAEAMWRAWPIVSVSTAAAAALSPDAAAASPDAAAAAAASKPAAGAAPSASGSRAGGKTGARRAAGDA